MAWYVKYENGIETERKKAGRGRPPAGFVREAEGNEDDPKQKMMFPTFGYKPKRFGHTH